MQFLAAIREGAQIFKSGRAAFLNGNLVLSPDAIGNRGRKKLVVGFADNVRRCFAQKIFSPRVAIEINPVRIFQPDHAGQRLQQRAQATAF